MSLKEDVLKHKNKLDARMRMKVLRLSDDTNPDKPLFSALLQFSGAGPLAVPGAEISGSSINITGAHNITLRGLFNLVSNDRVNYIEASTPMFPAAAPPPSPPKP